MQKINICVTIVPKHKAIPKGRVSMGVDDTPPLLLTLKPF